ncbi:MAG TPA: glutathione S-transferase family protein [Stellaceae bacterium]|nr:glutathione S-transferase family protein [Stellaceae bacterium]
MQNPLCNSALDIAVAKALLFHHLQLSQWWREAMDGPYTVYGSPGSGSVPVEAALTLIGAPYEVIGETVLRDVSRNPGVFKVNPLGQVPALVLPGGEVMTESAAILIWLADHYPTAGLAPRPSDERRSAFLRWMAYVSSAIYGLAWVRGDPMRLVSDKGQVEVVLERIANRRADCWRWMDAQVRPGRFLLGDELGVLDLYVATVSRWSPHRNRFYREAPGMAEVVRHVDADPRLAKFWEARFPFFEGWEG